MVQPLPPAAVCPLPVLVPLVGLEAGGVLLLPQAASSIEIKTIPKMAVNDLFRLNSFIAELVLPLFLSVVLKQTIYELHDVRASLYGKGS
ncbi:hypothetical protein KSF_059990 [Reticulibacter mediterranei]|uniref:Uncharacterized protein n=1 Tax=Reticulibacter mediterranei TaxID=2778369 RepID=A0A8J3IK38_9CHLR|nr:hypothetical protein KSF_059990 [Reticulibacter mediterranei]